MTSFTEFRSDNALMKGVFLWNRIPRFSVRGALPEEADSVDGRPVVREMAILKRQ